MLFLGALGDVHRLVADALEVGHQAQRRGQEPQVVGHRLAQGQDAQHQRVDVHLVAVDVAVDLLDLGRELAEPSQKALSASCRARSQRAPMASEWARSSRSSDSKSRLVWAWGTTGSPRRGQARPRALARPRPDRDGDHVEQERQDEQDEGRAVEQRLGPVDVGRLRGQDVHVVAEAHERVVEVRGQVRQVVGDAGEQDGRHLAGPAADRQDGAGQDAAQRLGQHHARDGLHARRPQGQAGLAQLARDRQDGLFGGDHHDGQRQDGQRERRPQEARLAVDRLPAEGDVVDAPPHRRDEEPQPEEAEDNRRHAGQVGHAHPDEPGDERPGRRELGQVDGRGDAGRHGGHGHEQRHEQRAEDGREDAARHHPILGRLADELPGHRARTAEHDVAHDDDQHHQDDHRGRSRQRLQGAVAVARLADQPAARRGRRDGGHETIPSLRRMECTMRSPARFTTNVARNSMAPRANSTS